MDTKRDANGELIGDWRTYKSVEEAETKPFDKDVWLEQLAKDIDCESEVISEDGFALKHMINIKDLESILQYYFPQIKLIDYDRTPTNTGDNSPELASNTTASI